MLIGQHITSIEIPKSKSRPPRKRPAKMCPQWTYDPRSQTPACTAHPAHNSAARQIISEVCSQYCETDNKQRVKKGKIFLKTLQPRQILQFGPFGFDPNAHILLKDGEPVRLTRKAAETLLVLIQQSPNVVSKDDLLAAVWPDQIIDEHNLTQSISTARRVLGVSAGQPGYIETFPGHGYRILGPVILSQAPVPDVNPAAPGGPPTTDHPVATKETGIFAAAGRSRVRRRFLRWLAPAALVIAMAAFAVFRFSARLRADHPVALRIVPLSRHGGLQYQPEVSPDGQPWRSFGRGSPPNRRGSGFRICVRVLRVRSP